VTPEQPVKVVAVFPVYVTVKGVADPIVSDPAVSKAAVETTVMVVAETVVGALSVVPPVNA
jgi:hypothetical protein